jgi:hypothetical protein
MRSLLVLVDQPPDQLAPLSTSRPLTAFQGFVAIETVRRGLYCENRYAIASKLVAQFRFA